MESAEIMAPFTALASEIDSFVLPTAVGPVRIIKGFFKKITYTILLNFFSSSRFEMEMIVGRPCGQ